MSVKSLVSVIVLSVLMVQGAIAEKLTQSATNTIMAENSVLFVFGNFNSPLPEKYSQFEPFSVVPVRLPERRLRAMNFDEEVNMSTRQGGRVFAVVHDNRYLHDNKDWTWVGYLKEFGVAYRAVITFSVNGAVFGQVQTPEGIFKLETVEHRTYLLDMVHSGIEQMNSGDDLIIANTNSPISEKEDETPQDTPVFVISAKRINARMMNNIITRARQTAKDTGQDVEFLIQIKAK